MCWYPSVKLRKISSEKRSVELLSECGSEVKASSFDDVIVKGVWGNSSDRRLFKEKNIKDWSRDECRCWG